MHYSYNYLHGVISTLQIFTHVSMFDGNRLPSEGPSEPTSPQFTTPQTSTQTWTQPSTQPRSKRNREMDMDDAIIDY